MPDPGLKRLVRRYQNTMHQGKPARHTQAAFEALEPVLSAQKRAGRSLHLDSCCGVGASTARWAQQHPNAFVIGVDKSEHRLGKHDYHEVRGVRNYEVIRADCAALWSLLVGAGWQFAHHNLWYPNPWPKRSQRQRRWYAMPAIVPLMRLQRRLSVRSNCAWYIEDFAWALRWWGHDPTMRLLAVKGEPMTPFERKYADSGQALWALDCDFQRIS